MDAVFQFFRKDGIDHAVLFDARLAAEGFRDDENAEMAFTIRPRAGMAGVVVGFVDDLECRRREAFL